MTQAAVEKKEEKPAEKEKKKPLMVEQPKPAQKLDIPALEPEGIMKEARSLEQRAVSEREKAVQLVKKEYEKGAKKKRVRKKGKKARKEKKGGKGK